MRGPQVQAFFSGFLFGFIFACVVIGILMLIGCSPKDDGVVYDKESGCMVQFKDEHGELQKPTCKHGVASTKVPTPLYPATQFYPEGPKVRWCVCKPW